MIISGLYVAKNILDCNKMTEKISPEQMARYKCTARRRQEAEKKAQVARRERAWQLAHQAATLLKTQYNVKRVMLFGSLTHPNRFTHRSDVDLAAWGLTSTNWLRAILAVRNLSPEIELNLVDVSCCSPELLTIIEQEGIVL